jgi:hypothetical protein
MVRTNLQEFAGDVHVLSNLQVGSNLFANDLAANVLNVIGSIGANLFVGDGGLLSNIATTLDDIIDQGNTVSNTIIFVSGNDATSNTGIITRSNVGISISNTEPTGEYQLTVGSNIFVNTHASNVLTVVGRIGSDYFVGDGGLLSNIATTLDQIVDQGNTISNTVILESGQDSALTSNIGLVSRENVGISVSNSNPTGEFQFGVGSNLFVNTYSSNVLTVEGNVLAQKLTFGTATVTSAYNLSHVTAQGSVTDQTISLTNATTGLAVTSNATVGGNVTAETVISTANVEVGDRLKFASNVFVDDLRVADVAANLVTYDKTTGELMDSGGLFANKLAVVSVQPPSALSANTTTIAKHGTYTVTTSSLAANSNAWNAFDGDSAVEWLGSTTSDHVYNGGAGTYSGTSNLFAGNYIQPGVSSAGEWLAVEFPYKTTLRHMKLTPPATYQQYPASANVYATNDSLTWTEVVNWSDVNPGDQQSNVQTIIVNATESYKKYAMVVTKTNGSDTNTALAEWKLFTESFSIDGGKVEMASSAVMGGETTMDQHGPHGRGEAKLKKYPEIVFEEGKFDGSRTSTDVTYDEQYYLQAGTTIKVVNEAASRVAHQAFNGDIVGANGNGWHSQFGFDREGGLYDTSNDRGDTFTDTNGDSHLGMWIQTKFPNKIKVKNINLYIGNNLYRYPKSLVVLGHSSLSSLTDWTLLHTETNISSTTPAVGDTTPTVLNVNADTAFDCYTILVKTIRAETGNPGQNSVWLSEIQYYGYEELATQGDTSVDTTFTSIMNTPQTTGANVYVDGSLGETFTNRVTGPDATGPSATYDATGKYWELNGSLESNITLEANTFLSGDAPHSVSVWFNSSNLEANVSNTCVFSVSDQEKLDSVNLDLQSNTWHNLTYAYQGEGGSRVTYLDGRKVAEDQAEDTFGEYPPFAMTGYAQGGYVVSASAENGASFPSWKAFNNENGSGGDSCWSVGTSWNATDNFFSGTASIANEMIINLDGVPNTTVGGVGGHWINLELPHRLIVDYVEIHPRYAPSSDWDERVPEQFYIVGSNDGYHWYTIHYKNTNGVPTIGTPDTQAMTGAYSNIGFKNIRMYVTKVGNGQNRLDISIINYYGHRENDLVRLPDPTNVLKYPHIAMTGPAQRGYVATHGTSVFSSRVGYRVFSGNTNSSWETDNNAYDLTNNGVAQTGTATFGAYTGHWVKLELPHKIVVSGITLYSYLNNSNSADDRRPDAGAFLGSDNDSTWNLIHAFGSGSLTWTSPSTTNVNLRETNISSMSASNTNAYKYIVFVITHKAYSGVTITRSTINELELYGTEENSSIPIQIGGGNIDRVANFRVYDKFVGEDQALEIWDAQKDAFRGVKNSVTLHKGRLGIGTTEPQGRLAVLDEPHNLEEFPPGVMSGGENFGGGGGETYFTGYGKFRATASNSLSGTTYGAIKAFNKANIVNTDRWRSNNDFTNGVANTSYVLADGVTPGVWIKLEMPLKIKLASYEFVGQEGQGPADAELWASNDDTNWTKIHSFSGNTIGDNASTAAYSVNSENFYKIYAMVVLKTVTLSGVNATSIKELRYFGTREQGQSVLHDGQLTLTKSLTVPRIGPALDADDTPRRDRLVVEYNTSTNPTFEGAVRDTSGRGNDGVFYGEVSYDATEKALVFDGNGDYIQSSGVTLPTAHSMSVWFNMDSDQSGINSIMHIGTFNTGDESRIFTSGNILNATIYGSTIQYDTSLSPGNWYHVVYTFTDGTTFNTTNAKIYVNGQLIPTTQTQTAATLNLVGNTVTIGATSTGAEAFKGKISNPKLYDTILEPSEVKTLYDMGRCDEGHHVVNFSKTRVGIGLGDGEAPTYTLDVRGQIRSQGSLVTSFTGQHKCVPEEPVEKGLIVSAKKNQFVKLNGSLDTGKSAITIDESLPVVSLSNVAKDKACFGVVSSTEEANTVYRVETTNGGVISYIPKTLGDNRAIVNSVGEGAIWVVNTGGPLESGDYITTSNVAGYGQKQDDDVLHNYTVAKITMDCDFTGSNVAVQTIKREETGLRTITEDTWNTLVDYDRSSNAETQYSNTLVPSAYSGQLGYVPREVTTIVDYTDGSNTISIEEWSNLESNIQTTYQSNTFTEIVDYTKFISLNEWSNLTVDVQNTYSEAEITTYYQIQRGENVLDENGQLQWEDKTGATESPYERRFLDASGVQTDEANAVHIAAFVGCTYHCG